MNSIKFIIKSGQDLTKKELNYLIDKYHKNIVKYNGLDVYDAYLKVLKIKKYPIPLNKKALKDAFNYQELEKILNNLKKSNLKIIIIYNITKIIGIGRIAINNEYITILDLIYNNDLELLQNILNYIENYYQKYKLIKIKIPIKNSLLLPLLIKNGYQELTDDIVDKDYYIYSKFVG